MSFARRKLAAAGVMAVIALSGCGSGGTAAAPETETRGLEQLASEAKCQPDIQTDTAEIRQAICKNDDGRFILATFSTDQGQRAWLDAAKDHGGHYLVGAKWVAVGETKMVTALRDQLGGNVEEGLSHSGAGAGGGGEAHSGHDG